MCCELPDYLFCQKTCVAWVCMALLQQGSMSEHIYGVHLLCMQVPVSQIRACACMCIKPDIVLPCFHAFLLTVHVLYHAGP